MHFRLTKLEWTDTTGCPSEQLNRHTKSQAQNTSMVKWSLQDAWSTDQALILPESLLYALQRSMVPLSAKHQAASCTGLALAMCKVGSVSQQTAVKTCDCDYPCCGEDLQLIFFKTAQSFAWQCCHLMIQPTEGTKKDTWEELFFQESSLRRHPYCALILFLFQEMGRKFVNGPKTFLKLKERLMTK